MVLRNGFRALVCLSIAVVVLFAGCAKGPHAVHDSKRFIRDHNLGNLPKFDIPVEINDRVIAWMEYFQGPGRGHFQRYMERSGRYMPLMQEILKKNGMPQDLIYIALIESGFNTQARSYASAVGPWQFMSYTGRDHGLRIDGFVDERRDPYRATEAAAQYFRTLYDQFGDWYLALTAYNAGPGRVQRAIDATGSRDFWEISSSRKYLLAEQRDYVPKFIAAAIMAKSPERFGFGKIDYKEPFNFDSATVETQTDIPVVAKCAGVSEDDIIDLNPHLVGGTTPPYERNYSVRLPRGSLKRFGEKYALLSPDERVQVVRYEVRKGDTLARVAKRYGVSASMLASANGINRKQKHIPVGTTLVIPRGSASVRIAVRSNGQSSVRGETKNATHLVKRGDTVSLIAKRYKISPKQLMAMNGIRKSGKLRPGTSLVIKSSQVRERNVASSSESGDRRDKTVTVAKNHKVVKGETLGSISKRYGIPVKQLMAMNGITNPKSIRPGSTLVVSKSTIVAKVDRKAPRNGTPLKLSEDINPPSTQSGEVSSAPESGEVVAMKDTDATQTNVQASPSFSDTISSSEEGTTPVDLREKDVKNTHTAPVAMKKNDTTASLLADISYKVKNGDTLWEIARRHKVSISQIQKWNNLSDPSSVKPGTTLTIKKE
jgi:membrane-bound lytic murein transglycosylase D